MVGWLKVGSVVGLGFGLQGIFCVSRRRLTKNAEHNNVGWGWVSSCCCVYFKFLGLFFSFGFDDFSGFMGLICWRFWWRIRNLNEFLQCLFAKKM